MSLQDSLPPLPDVGPRIGSLGEVALWKQSGTERLARPGDPSTTRGTDSSRIQLLGPGKPLALLVYLAAAPQRRASRAHLAGLLWSDRLVEDARHVLRQVIWSLRRRVDEHVLSTEGEEIVLARHVSSDREAFVRAVDEGRFDDAIAAYAGDFLPSFAAPGAAEFELWVDLERQRLRSLFLRVVEMRARQMLASGHARKAAALALRGRDADPSDQGAWRLLLEALGSAGDHLSAAAEADRAEQLFASDGIDLDAASRTAIRVARRGTNMGVASTGEGTMQKSLLVADLVGRERAFSQLLEAWERARRGAGAQRFEVIGESGMGKTRLVADLSTRLRVTGSRTAVVRAYPSHRSVRYSLAGDLVSALAALPGAAGVSGGTANTLVALDIALSTTFPNAVPEQSASDEVLRRRILAVSELISAVADDAPLALVIDDLHWADEDSLKVILGASERLASERAFVVLVSRPSPAVGAARVPCVQLDPLSEADIDALLASLGDFPDRGWAATLAPALRTATAGVPLLVLETLQELLDRGRLSRVDRAWSSPDPDALFESLRAGTATRHRLARLTSNERRALLHLAIAGRPVDADALARGQGMALGDLHSLVEGLERNGHVHAGAGGIELTHDTLSEALIADAAPDECRVAHAERAAALAERPDARAIDLVRAGQHLQAAGDSTRVPALLERAVLLLRRGGDRRSRGELARDLSRDVLGASAEPQALMQLERATRGRVNRGRRRLLAAATVMFAAAVTWGGQLIGASATQQPEAAIFVTWDFPYDEFVRRIELDRSLFEPSVSAAQTQGEGLPPIPVRTTGRAAEGLISSVLMAGEAVPAPGGGEWAAAQLGPVYSRIATTGTTGASFVVRHLAKVRDPSWAPNGSEIVFARERYDADAYELAIVEVNSRRVRTIFGVAVDASDRTPVWGPDGTRIVFVRAASDTVPGDLCWTSVDGETGRCGVVSARIWAVRAWDDAQHAVVEVGDSSRRDLARIGLDDGQVEVLHTNVGPTRVSPDGRWVARRCAEAQCGPSGWMVGPARGPARWRALEITPPEEAKVARRRADVQAGLIPPDFKPTSNVYWGAALNAAPYVARLMLMLGGLGTGERLEIHAETLDQYGQLIRPSLKRAYSMDPDVAEIDSTGHVRWLRPRSAVRFVWNIGGWKADTSVNVSPDSTGAPVALAERRAILREALRRWSSAVARP